MYSRGSTGDVINMRTTSRAYSGGNSFRHREFHVVLFFFGGGGFSKKRREGVKNEASSRPSARRLYAMRTKDGIFIQLPSYIMHAAIHCAESNKHAKHTLIPSNQCKQKRDIR